MDRTIYAGERTLKADALDSPDPVSLLYRTGYLTISDYAPMKNRYTLSFPNEEVRAGFQKSLVPSVATFRDAHLA